METRIEQSNEFDVVIQMGPGSSAAEITLKPGQKFTAEAGAMIAMSPTIEMNTSTHQKQSGGFLKGLK